MRNRPGPAALVVAVASGAAVLLVLAGSAFGPAGFFFCVPVAVGALAVARRVEAHLKGLRLLSQQDALTGLGNRRLLRERLKYEISRHRRHSRRFSVLVLDLDGFKGVNDRFGHAAGDEILREIAAALGKAVRDQDTVTRVGGDEFCVLAPETGWEDAERLTERLEEAVEHAVGGLDMLGVSVGFSVFPDEGWTAEQLLKRADDASIQTKRRSQRERDVRAA